MARGVGVPNPASFASLAIREGVSATQGLADLRAVGWGIRTQTWYQAYNGVLESVANTAAVDALARDAVVPDSAHAPWATRTPGQYAYQNEITLYDPTTKSFQFRQSTVMASIPLSPEDAEQLASDDWENQPDDTNYPLINLGARMTNAYITVEIQ